MSGNFRLVDLEEIGPTINGLGFGGRPRVLCRTAAKMLVLVPGYTSYVSRMWPHNAYSPTALWRFYRAEHGGQRGQKIAEGGRFTAERLLELGPKIDAAMGEEGLASLLDLKKTLVLGDNPPFSRLGHEIPAKGSFGYGHKSDADELVRKLRERKQ